MRLFEKVREIENIVKELLPEELKEKYETMVTDIGNLVGDFHQRVDDEKDRVYHAFVGQFPERKEEVKRFMEEQPQESGLIDDLSEKLVSIEKGKKSILIDLERQKVLQ
jgi:hypothetical protein